MNARLKTEDICLTNTRLACKSGDYDLTNRHGNYIVSRVHCFGLFAEYGDVVGTRDFGF